MKRSENTQVAFQHEHSLSLLKMPNAEISRPHLNCDFLQETQVQSRGQEDPLEKGMALHREIPWTGVSGGLQSMAKSQDRTEQLTLSPLLSCPYFVLGCISLQIIGFCKQIYHMKP